MAFTSWLNKGTLITLEDGSQKAIESIEVGDSVQTFDMNHEDFDSAHIENNEQSATEVKEVKENTVDGGSVSTITFDNGSEVTLTNDYPIYGYSEDDAWIMCDVEATEVLYGTDDEDGGERFSEVKVGTEAYLDGDDTSASVTDVETHKDGTSFSMYTISTLEAGNTVFANHIMVAAGSQL